jgi:membrane associated rhomboid family serine protease
MNDALSRARALPLPWILIASVTAVSLLAWAIKPVWHALLLQPFRVRQQGHVHRLLTAGWVHGSLSHLVFNMVSLYFFAEPVLRVLGTTRFLALYVSAVVLAFVPTTLRHMRDPKYCSVGASGAITAVMFSGILLDPTMKLYVMLVPIPVPAAVFAVGYLAYSAWSSYRSDSEVNHDAHFAGAIYGVIFTYAFEPTRVARAFKMLF